MSTVGPGRVERVKMAGSAQIVYTMWTSDWPMCRVGWVREKGVGRLRDTLLLPSPPTPSTALALFLFSLSPKASSEAAHLHFSALPGRRACSGHSSVGPAARPARELGEWCPNGLPPISHGGSRHRAVSWNGPLLHCTRLCPSFTSSPSVIEPAGVLGQETPH